MSIKLVPIIPAILAVSACSGGGGGSNTISEAPASVVRVFSDGSGVARGQNVNSGAKLLFVGPDIAQLVSDVNDGPAPDAPELFGNIEPVGSAPGGGIRQEGAISVGSVAANVTAVTNPDDTAGIFYFDDPNASSLVVASGSDHQSLPEGSFTYSGTLATGLRSTDPMIEYGTFTMDADFANQTFEFDGQTASDTLDAVGVIDVEDGQFSASNVQFVTSGTQRGGRLYGNVHGANGDAVSGVAHSGESSPVYGAAFVSTN